MVMGFRWSQCNAARKWRRNRFVASYAAWFRTGVGLSVAASPDRAHGVRVNDVELRDINDV